MPEIGAALREARMRQRIDISEIESRTKIRAKYLRALENEEWELLPGPTFVKSFLRTYAQALELDDRLLLEEYKLRHERLSEHELMPIAPPGRRERSRRGPPPGAGRDVLVALLVVGVVALLIVLGNGGGDSGGPAPAPTATTPARTTRTAPPRRRPPRRTSKPAAPKVARLEVVPTGPVWICLRAAGDRTLIGGQVVDTTTRLPAYRASRFTMTLGNGAVKLRVNGRTLDVPDVQNAIGYEITRSGKRTVLGEAERPTCS